MKSVLRLWMPVLPLLCSATILLPRIVPAQSPPAQALVEFTSDTKQRIVPTSEQVSVTRGASGSAMGIAVTIQPGKEDYPGIHIKPTGAGWNLSRFGHVEARVVNTGTRPVSIALRVDSNDKEYASNTESVFLQPGATGTVKVIFGYAYGYKPSQALDTAKIVNLVLFVQKFDDVRSFRLESLVAAGTSGEKPPVAPDDVRVAPHNGALLGTGVSSAAAPRIVAQGVQITPNDATSGQTFQVKFPAGTSSPAVSLRPSVGRWDLRDYLAVNVTLRNPGSAPMSPRARLESNGGVSEWVTAAKPLAPGETTTLTIPFQGKVVDLSKPETLAGMTSDAVSAVTIEVDKTEADKTEADKTPGEAKLQVERVQAVVPPATMPAWLGKRPPVSGDWIKTLDEEFDGNTLNTKIWSVSGENYWDKTSHWSKDNVLIGNGVVKLRYQKKTGYNNDDPKQKPSDYASGYLHTYDKWAQRYGYFEARMKLPTSPGLWPAFWMMPDRGDLAAPQWKRQDTANGGMELDIMEHLTRWGPKRYNIAMHWDGYDKDHKSLGSDKIYMQPDKDGFITAGLLWTPGAVVYYCNGREVLRWDNPRISSVPEILMFTLPMGGWDNSPLNDARLPADFVIDYVRVWQRKDFVSGADSKAVIRK